MVPSCGGTTQLGLLVLVHAGAMVVSADRRGRRRVVIAKARMVRATTRAMLLASSQADKDVCPVAVWLIAGLIKGVGLDWAPPGSVTACAVPGSARAAISHPTVTARGLRRQVMDR